MSALSIVRRLQSATHKVVRTPAQLQSLAVRHPGIASAIREVLQHRLTSVERLWIDRIEQVRKELKTSNEPIEFLDFGAGNPGDIRTLADHTFGVKTRSTVAKVVSVASKSSVFGLLLFKLVRAIQPSHSIELGTCVGISAAYQAAALEVNGSGELITLEGAETLAQIAKNNLFRLGLSQRVSVMVGRFEETLDQVISKPVQFAFIDGNHEQDATLRYWDKLSASMPPGSVVIFDDINGYEEMENAWRKLQQDRRFTSVVDMFSMGMGIVGEGNDTPELFRVSIK